MRRFKEHDWYGFAGAEEDADRPALIGEAGNYILVVDLNGVGAYHAEDDELSRYIHTDYVAATALAVLLERDNPSVQLLDELGFKPY